MSKNRTDLITGNPLPESALDALQEYISTIGSNFKLSLLSAVSVQLAAGVGSGQACLGIDGAWRYNTAAATAAHPGGAAGLYDVVAVASANNIATGDVDNTDYSFGLVIGASPFAPAGNYNGNPIAHYRKVGEAVWSGSAITRLRQTIAGPPTLPSHPQATVAGNPVFTGRDSGGNERIRILDTGEIDFADPTGSVFDTTLYRAGVGALKTDGSFNASGYQVAGTALASTHLSDSAQLARLAGPIFTGVPTAPTAAQDANTTQIATTAFVVGQASIVNPNMDGAAAAGSSLRYARADHVHPVDTSRAPLASPTFTGTPVAPTALADTSTTQLATTAYVTGQAGTVTPAMDGVAAVGSSLRYARADHVHPVDTSRAPLASPSFTGTVTIGGALAHTGTTVGFYAVTPAARPSARTQSNWTLGGNALRTIDRNNFTLQNLYDYIATLTSDLQSVGLLA